MKKTESLKDITIRENPRSSTRIIGERFIKTSSELNLKNEAMELERYRNLHLASSHIKATEFICFDSDSNELTTRYIPSCQSLFNIMWNNSSLLGFLRGKRLDHDKLMERIEAIGKWLKTYHESSFFPNEAQNATDTLLTLFNSKIEAISKNKILDNTFLLKLKDLYFPEIEKLADPRYNERHKIRICQIHGDFIAYNMLANENMDIHVLDFADTRIGAAVEDIGRFYELIWAMEKISLLHKKTFLKAGNVFLRSYGIEEIMLSTKLFSAIRALNGLIHCISEFTQRGYMVGRLVTKVELKLITRVSLNRMAKEVGVPY